MNAMQSTNCQEAGRAVVISVNVSDGGIPKHGLEVVTVEPSGIVGDAHDHEKHNTPEQALSIIDLEDLDDLRAEGFDVKPGATGENITVRGLDVDAMQVGDRLQFSGGVEVQLSKRRKPCYVLDSIDPRLKDAIAGRCGFYARVIHAGTIRAGEIIAPALEHS